MICRWSAPVGLVGDTIEATLMLLVIGDTKGWGNVFVETGDGVLSPLTLWKPECVGLRTLTAL